MTAYYLTNAADADLSSIYRYGVQMHGLEAANAYLDGMIEKFDQIAANPLQYMAVEALAAGLRRAVYKVNVIYFRDLEGAIEIVRILRAEDLGAAFDQAT